MNGRDYTIWLFLIVLILGFQLAIEIILYLDFINFIRTGHLP